MSKLHCCVLLSVLVVVCLTCATASATTDGLAQEPRPESWKADAALTDITFVDRKQGWAVGSHGVLLRTDDGGKTWGEGNLASTNRRAPQYSLDEKLQRVRAKEQLGGIETSTVSPFSCRFETVSFADSQNGWAAGGYDLPGMNQSRAVIARTNDGGKSWQPVPQLMIGRIHRIEFRGMQRLSGWAIGAHDSATDASLFYTSDAGNMWSGQKSNRVMPDLIDAETAGHRFVGIDHDGQPLHFDTSKLEYSVITEDGNFSLNDVAMADEKNGWAVGTGGTLLKTINTGLSWSTATTETQPLSSYDFRCVHINHNKVWFAGNPGNTIFSIDRATGKLSSHHLPGGAAVNSISFVDEEYGWAVGDLGKIWATTDGGANWKLQRSGASQIGVLIVCKTPGEVPLEFIARHAGEDGKLVGVIVPKSKEFDAVRLAAERLGAVLVSPVVTDTDDELLSKTVRAIRSLRPTIVVGSSTKLLETAIRLAAAPSNTGLNPWQVQYLMAADPNGPIEYENSVFLTRMGTSLDDFVIPSRVLCGLPVRNKTRTAFLAWQFVGNGKDARLVELEESPFSRFQSAKRQQKSVSLSSWTTVRKTNEKRQVMRKLLNMEIDSVEDASRCRSGINQLASLLVMEPNGDHLGGVWLMQLADEFVAAGQPQRAAWALEALATKYPNHCMSPLALKTLASYYSSSELNRFAAADWQKLRNDVGYASRIPAEMQNRSQDFPVRQTRLEDGRNEYRWGNTELDPFNPDVSGIDLPPAIDVKEELKGFDPATVDLSLDVETKVEEPEVDETTQQSPASMSEVEIDMFLKERYRNAAGFFSRLAARDPGLAKRADLQFLQAHIIKKLSGIDNAKPYFQNVLKSAPHNIFTPAARDELRGDNRTTATQVIATDQRPHLDGLPNDPVWRDVMTEQQMIKLAKFEDSLLGDIAMVARDDEYLYVYARCYKSGRSSYAAGLPGKRRQRDANLSYRDRVEFSFDVDRDLASAFRISIDYRGQVCESCGAAKSWNPKMFAANFEDERIWSVEFAIPVTELAQSPELGDVWRMNIHRTRDEAHATDGVFWGTPQTGSLLIFTGKGLNSAGSSD